jgi:hypothetical protein
VSYVIMECLNKTGLSMNWKCCVYQYVVLLQRGSRAWFSESVLLVFLFNTYF